MQLLDGFLLGHWTDSTNGTGCTVLRCPPRTVASCEVRGSSPGSRELVLLNIDKKTEEVHAVVLTGGSAYGLAAADGVAQWLERQGTGYRTPWGIVPIVPAAVVFDLNVGSFDVRPGPKEGAWACEAARPTVAVQGNVGAGTGATVGKWSGIEGRMKGGFGIAEWHDGDLCVQALAVANAVGDVIDHDGSIIAGARASQGGFAAELSPLRPFERGKVLDRTNTTLAVLLTNAGLSKVQCFRLAQRMHDGMSRAVVPVHTSFDGDTTFALSAGVIAADIDLLGECAAQLTSEAIRSAVRHASEAFGIPAASSAAVRSSGPATSL